MNLFEIIPLCNFLPQNVFIQSRRPNTSIGELCPRPGIPAIAAVLKITSLGLCSRKPSALCPAGGAVHQKNTSSRKSPGFPSLPSACMRCLQQLEFIVQRLVCLNTVPVSYERKIPLRSPSKSDRKRSEQVAIEYM